MPPFDSEKTLIAFASVNFYQWQSAVNCSKSTMETSKQYAKSVQS